MKNWCPEAFIVSFKLETDPDLLISKAEGALRRYGHHCVIANVLSERRTRVTFVRPDKDPIVVTEEGIGEIEEKIIDQLLEFFKIHI